MPYEVLTVVDPKVLEIFGLSRRVLKASKEDDVVLVIH